MKHIKIMIVILAVACIAAGALEDTFKEQMEYYNTQIIMAEAMYEFDLDRNLDFITSKNKMKAIINQRNDLKIKVLETLKELPAWWKEPERKNASLQKK